MKNCTDCKYAKWHRTATGKLHPSGKGNCTYDVKIPPLPASKYWGWGVHEKPSISGGFINRRKELHDHCVYYTNQEATR